MDEDGVVGPLEDVLGSLVACDPGALDDAAVRDALLALLRCRNQLDAVIGKFVGVFDERRLSHRDGFRSTRQWLVGFGRLSGPAAGGRLRAVTVTGQLPELAAAFAAGDVSAEHVDRIGVTAEEVGETVIGQAEATLVDLARQANPEHLREACGHLRDLALADSNTPKEEQFRRRGVTLSRLGDMWRLRGVLDTETGALLSTTLDAFMATPTPGDDRSPAQRRHDALADMLNVVLRTGQAPDVAGVPPHVGLLMPVHRYLRLHDHRGSGSGSGTDASNADVSSPDTSGPYTSSPGASSSDTSSSSADAVVDDNDGAAVLSNWGPVSDELAARLSCDAILQQLWLHPENGVPLRLGRAYRNTPPALRRALAARDPFCRWPGCRIPAHWCDSHHLQEWIRDHGETNVDNLVNLCRYHHVCMHERGWRLDRDVASGLIWVTRPDGRRYELGPSRPRVDATPFGSDSGLSVSGPDGRPDGRRRSTTAKDTRSGGGSSPRGRGRSSSGPSGPRSNGPGGDGPGRDSPGPKGSESLRGPTGG